MIHFQNFDKIDSFLFVLGNLIAGWSEGVIKMGTGSLHQIYRFSGVVG